MSFITTPVHLAIELLGKYNNSGQSYTKHATLVTGQLSNIQLGVSANHDHAHHGRSPFDQTNSNQPNLLHEIEQVREKTSSLSLLCLRPNGS